MSGDVVQARIPVSSTGRGLRAAPYSVFAALCQLWPALHHEEGIQIARLRRREGDPEGALLLRLPAGQVGGLLDVSGAALMIGAERLVLGYPRIEPLDPSDVVSSRLVLYYVKTGSSGPGSSKAPHGSWPPFEAAVREGLARVGVDVDRPGIEIQPGRRASTVVRRYEQWGYGVEVSGLTGPESLTIQAEGIGSRRHFGAGWFDPAPLPRHCYATGRDVQGVAP